MTKASKTRASALQASAASGNDSPQNSFATITSALAANPTLAPSVAAKQLFPPPSAARRGFLRFKIKEQLEEGRGKHWQWNRGAVHEKNIGPDDDELEKVRLQFGYKEEENGGPGRLYLTMLADSILPLPRDPMSGVVSPPILATTGIVPLSIFSTGPDIIGHYYDCIVAAKKEVILLTNYWQGGKNVDRIADALRELNKKVQARREEKALKTKNESHSHSNGNANPENANGQAFPTSDQNGDAVGSPTIKLDPPTLDEQIVVKLMWDRGPQTLADLFRLRKPVPPGMWKTNGLPEEKEIPNLKMEILNYHRPLMGTFHAKLLLVDRQVALINSNNIQDRPNVEACVRLEGDIVNAVYDHALISWGNPLQPPLPCLGLPAEVNPGSEAFASGDGHLPPITAERMKTMANQARLQLLQDDQDAEEEKEMAQSPRGRMSFGDVVDSVMRPRETAGRDAEAGATTEAGGVDSEKAARRAGQLWAQKVLGERFQGMRFSGGTPQSEETENAAANNSSVPTPAPALGQPANRNRHFADVVDALMRKEGIKPGGWAEGALEAFGLGPSSSRNVADEVRKNRSSRKNAAARGVNIPKAVKEEKDKPTGALPVDGEKERDESTMVEREEEEGSKAVEGKSTSNDEVFEEDDSASSISSTENDNNQSETTPGSMAYRSHHRRTRSTLSRASAAEKLENITKALDFANLSQVKGEIRADQLEELTKTQNPEALLEFLPYVLHKPHEPVPMALVNRRPHGTPGHSDIRNPQDAAWLAAFRYAEKHVFIQSPTLNASPIKAAVLACVRRHVRVELWLDLGFNDKSESMPFQGGTNEQVVTGMYRQLRREGKGDEKYLEVFWYTGKDMTRPLNAVRKQRNCHIKFAAVDGRVAILGSGNQDTQSWFHSQEINVMVDSTQIVTEWLDALRRNQSTHLYGKVDQRDGIWRGQSGSEKADTGADN